MPSPPGEYTVLVYEYLTGGGLYSGSPGALPVSSLLAEGAAMVQALIADFQSLAGYRVHALRDARQTELDLGECDVHLIHDRGQELQSLREWSARADWTVVIAPETGGALTRRVEVVEQAGGRLLGPGSAWVHLASDKTETARRLRAAGVSTPRSLEALEDARYPEDYPLVIKPVDGAGSLGLRWLESPPCYQVPCDSVERWRIERWVPGLPASVSLLCRGEELTVLSAGEQRFAPGPRRSYLGGRMPLPAAGSRRAARLARQALRALPGAYGFVGVDLVLGDADDGSLDVVIEINPRLTTSYIGLRALLPQNLPALMVSMAEGSRVEVELTERLVEFDADGACRLIV